MLKYILISLFLFTSASALAETTLSCQVKGSDGLKGEVVISETISVVITEKPLSIQLKGSNRTSASLSELLTDVKNDSTEDAYILQLPKSENCNIVGGGTKPGTSLISINLNRKAGKISVTNSYCSVKATYEGDCTKSGNKF